MVLRVKMEYIMAGSDDDGGWWTTFRNWTKGMSETSKQCRKVIDHQSESSIIQYFCFFIFWRLFGRFLSYGKKSIEKRNVTKLGVRKSNGKHIWGILLWIVNFRSNEQLNVSLEVWTWAMPIALQCIGKGVKIIIHLMIKWNGEKNRIDLWSDHDSCWHWLWNS